MMLLSYLAIYGLAGALVLGLLVLRPALWGHGMVAFGWALALGALAAAALTSGVYYTAQTYMGDLWVTLSALTQAQAGTRAHLDVFSPLGPVYAWMQHLALAVYTPGLQAVIGAGVLYTSGVLILSVVMLRARVSALTLAMVAALSVTTALSVREIDGLFAQMESSFLAPYNRWAWA